jgi:hypothetical protein
VEKTHRDVHQLDRVYHRCVRDFEQQQGRISGAENTGLPYLSAKCSKHSGKSVYAVANTLAVFALFDVGANLVAKVVVIILAAPHLASVGERVQRILHVAILECYSTLILALIYRGW